MYKEDLHVCDSSQRLQSAVHFIHLTDKPQNCWVMLGCMIRESLTTMWIFSHSLSLSLFPSVPLPPTSMGQRTS